MGMYGWICNHWPNVIQHACIERRYRYDKYVSGLRCCWCWSQPFGSKVLHVRHLFHFCDNNNNSSFVIEWMDGLNKWNTIQTIRYQYIRYQQRIFVNIVFRPMHYTAIQLKTDNLASAGGGRDGECSSPIISECSCSYDMCMNAEQGRLPTNETRCYQPPTHLISHSTMTTDELRWRVSIARLLIMFIFLLVKIEEKLMEIYLKISVFLNSFHYYINK